ncbi:cytochrome b5 [Acrasis kona]|uniref:Cytochrome b5 n=1 Tax=Acrasis kona TaxID=1008807 RepID=A0AAW2YQB9_9EUKA
MSFFSSITSYFTGGGEEPQKKERKKIIPLIDADKINIVALDDLKSRNNNESCYICIDGYIYDVTKFLNEHPGGEDILLDVSGAQDASEAFHDSGHSDEAIKQMEAYLVGRIQ